MCLQYLLLFRTPSEREHFLQTVLHLLRDARDSLSLPMSRDSVPSDASTAAKRGVGGAAGAARVRGELGELNQLVNTLQGVQSVVRKLQRRSRMRSSVFTMEDLAAVDKQQWKSNPFRGGEGRGERGGGEHDGAA